MSASEEEGCRAGPCEDISSLGKERGVRQDTRRAMSFDLSSRDRTVATTRWWLLSEIRSLIFVAGYINPHSQSFCSLAGKSPKIGPCLRVPQSVEPPIHGSRKIFPNWQHSWMRVSEPSPDGIMELLSAYVPQCWISTSEERGSPGDGPDIGIISEAACS
ncbi:hypothetical protein OUZ56_018236 [Daphnia magna]|uniref:Uncharacterized protein n=1 Tax=Daphnia magna TaxID=35525 RepID=A0ABQ9Z8H8_9CRUS|nr:hypothetical protein OUZ56_018236 [Daphnia magna]